MPLKTYLSQNIAKRILILFFFFSFLMTTVSTAIILYSQHHNEVKQIISDSQKTLENQLDSIHQVLWNLDKPLAITILNSLTNTPSFTFITIYDEQGNVFASSGRKYKAYSTSTTLPIIHNDKNKKSQKIGYVKANITTVSAINHVKNNFLNIIFTQVVKSFIASFVFLLLMYHILIKHILAINQFIVDNSKQRPKAKKYLELKRPYQNDELQRLVDTINLSQKTHKR